MNIQIHRLAEQDAGSAAAVTQLMARVFEHGEGSSIECMQSLLRDERFWLFGAFADDQPVGGLGAHVLPLTSQHGAELFIYDIAVNPGFQRRGIGRQLRQAALGPAAEVGLMATFVPAESNDALALAFYRSIGGAKQPVSMFTAAQAA